MGINDRYKSEFLDQVDASRRGDTVFIPIFLDRVNKVFNLMQSRYTLIFGSTGTGKTALMDYLYVLTPWSYLKTNELDIHWEVSYFSLERKVKFKFAKWVSWFIYRDHGIQVSGDELMGWGDDPLNDEGYKLVRSYDKEISEMLEHVHVYDGKPSINLFKRVIRNRARALGVLYFSDDAFVYRDDEPTPVMEFTDELIETTKTESKKYRILKHKGKPFKIYQNDKKYFLHNPKTFLFILVDGIGLMAGSKFSGQKSGLDAVTEILAEARDVYGFSPVVVSQQNRSLADIQRLKLHGNDLSPQLEDILGSSQMAYDADVVMAMFDPFYYKAYDSRGQYGGYDILQGMMHPKGFSRFRSLHILKNSFGFAGKTFGLKFVGESNDFTTLPFPDSAEINDIYSDISKGL